MIEVSKALLLGALGLSCCVGHPAFAASTDRISVGSGGLQANADSDFAVISANGRFVAFPSSATNLVPGGTNGHDHVFVRDRLTGTNEIVSVSSAEVQGNDSSGGGFVGLYPRHISISADGRFVAFTSVAGNLVADDTNGWQDVFVRDRQLGTTERVSVSSLEQQGNFGSVHPAISADGRFVAFATKATNFGDSEGGTFVRDRQLGTTTRVSYTSTSGQPTSGDFPAISADGRYVAFASSSDTFAFRAHVAGIPAAGSTTDILVRDRQEGTTELASIGTGLGGEPDDSSTLPSISADGRYVAFQSDASDIVPGGAGGSDVFVRDLVNNTTQQVSVNSAGAKGLGVSSDAWISADGRYVSFNSSAPNLVTGDTNEIDDTFVHDRQTHITERVSISNTGAQTNEDGNPDQTSISGDGRFVVFGSRATNLVAGDTNTWSDVFIRDRGELKDRFAVGDFDANNRDDFVADFGGRGVWALFGGTTWVRIHTLPSGGFGVGDFDATGRDDLAVDYDGGGLWVRYNNATWTKLHTSDAETLAAGDLDANPRDDLAVDFGAGGLWARYNNATWTRLHTLNADAVDTGDLDGNGRSELIVDFGAGGLWAYFNNTNWTRLNTANPEDIESADLDGGNRDEVIADLGAGGLVARYNNATTWTQLHPGNAEALAAGDFDANGKDDLAVDFGAGGLWVRLNNTTWTRVHTTNPQGLATADFDGNGKAELIVDFGAGGLWARYNNATWARLPALPP